MNSYRAFSALAVFAAGALVLSGCGGSAVTTPTQSAPVAKEQILTTFQRGVEQGAALAGSANRSRAKRQATREAEDRYFSEFLGLWVEPVFGNADDYTSPSGEKYTEDEAGQVDAGHDYIWVSDPSIYPIILRTERTILAGPFAGELDALTITFAEDESATMTGNSVWPGQGTYQSSAAWDPAGFGKWTGKFTALDNSWETYELVADAEPGPDLTITTSAGVTIALHYAEDGSGQGTITGSGEGLPATVVWDAAGDGTITWADGTTSAITVDPMF